MTQSNIVNGFRTTGLYPWDPSAIPEEAFAPSVLTHMTVTPSGTGISVTAPSSAEYSQIPQETFDPDVTFYDEDNSSQTSVTAPSCPECIQVSHDTFDPDVTFYNEHNSKFNSIKKTSGTGCSYFKKN